MHARLSVRVTLKFRGCSIFQKMPIMMRYNIYLRVQSKVSRKKTCIRYKQNVKGVWNDNKSIAFFYLLSLSDHNYLPDPAQIYDYEPLKKSIYFAIISADSKMCRFCHSPALSILYFCVDSVLFFVLLALGSTIVAHVAKSHNYVIIRVKTHCLLGLTFSRDMYIASCFFVLVRDHMSGQIDARFISNLD